jgi:PAS domain S-box-containing protein
MKLRSKLPLLLVGTSTVSVALVCVFAYVIARASMRTQVVGQLEAIASIQRHRIGETLKMNRDRLRLVASRTQLRMSLREFRRTAEEEHRRKVIRILTDARSAVHVFRRISVLDPQGTVLASTDDSYVGAVRAGTAYFQQGKKGITVKSLYRDEEGRLAAHLAAPLLLDEEFLGVAVVDCGMEDMLQLLRDHTALGSTGESFLVSRGENGIARVLTPLRHEKDAALRRMIPPEREQAPANTALRRQARRLEEATDYRGVKVLAATEYLPDPGWGLVVKIDREEALQPVTELGGVFLIALALSAGGVGLVSLRLGRSITAPLALLTRTAKRIRDGSFSERAHVETEDEIEELASTFNDMAERMEQELGRAQESESKLLSYKCELEQKVKERTQQLSEANRALRSEVEEHREIRSDLERLTHRTSLILQAAGEGLFGVDEEGRIVFVNPAGAEMLGCNTEVLRGRDLHETIHHSTAEGEEYPRQDCPIHSTLRSGKAHHGDELMWRADGTSFPVAFTSTPVERKGEEVRMVVVVEDVSERKERERQLRETMRELKRSNEQLERFAYVASHDLQEPLRKVRVFATRVQDRGGDELDERTQEYLHRMNNAAARMQQLIDDLLTFSRVNARGEPFREVDLSEVADDVVSDLHVRIEEANANVEVDYLPVIEADATQMRQMLQNLVVNGLKFHREGVPPEVRIRGNVEADENGRRVCRIEVADNGIGMDEKYLDRIFTIFQRLHPRDEYGGTGLGLALCQKIVERHNGEITARSTPGEGTTFIVILPVKQGDRAGHERS